ncbi:MAG: hypothetical protein ACLFV6_07600 [Spirulinaceae cyanobacterium]
MGGININSAYYCHNINHHYRVYSLIDGYDRIGAAPSDRDR